MHVKCIELLDLRPFKKKNKKKKKQQQGNVWGQTTGDIKNLSCER